jgi:hypothetical protein
VQSKRLEGWYNQKRYPRRNRNPAQRDSAQCSWEAKLGADGHAEVHVNSDEAKIA